MIVAKTLNVVSKAVV